MQTMQPTIKSGRNVWDKVNMPQAEFEARIARLRSAMEAAGVDVLLTYGTAFNESAETSYLTNFIVRLPQGTIVIVPKKEPVVLIFEGGSRNLLSVHDVTWVAEVKASADCAKEAVKYLKEKGLVPSRIGLAKVRERMPHAQYRLLMEGLGGSTIVDSSGLLDNERMVKSEREIDEMRRSGRTVKACFEFLTSARFASMNEHQVDALVRRQARLEGAEDVRVLIGKPGHADWSLRPAVDSTLSEGDTLIVYLACAFERYWTEAVRTFKVGRSSLEAYGSIGVTSLYEKVRAAVKPGLSTTLLYGEIMKGAQDFGLGLIADYGFGGSIGQGLDEWPSISPKVDMKLKQAVCLSLRLAAQDKAAGAVMVGDTVLVGTAGSEVLTA